MGDSDTGLFSSASSERQMIWSPGRIALSTSTKQIQVRYRGVLRRLLIITVCCVLRWEAQHGSPLHFPEERKQTIMSGFSQALNRTHIDMFLRVY